MNPCVKAEGKCNKSVSNQLKIAIHYIQGPTSNNNSEQTMKLTHYIHVCLIIF